MATRANSLLLPTKSKGETGPIVVDGQQIHVVFNTPGGWSVGGTVRLDIMAPLGHGETWTELRTYTAARTNEVLLFQPGVYRFRKGRTSKPLGIFMYRGGS